MTDNRRRFAAFLASLMGSALSLTLLAVEASQALTQGPNSPGTVVSDSSFGDAPWSFVDDAKVSDDLYATMTPNGNPSEYLKATSFGFSLPPTAVVEGLAVAIEKSSLLETVVDSSVRMVKGGTVTGADQPNGSTWPATDTVFNYGGVSDLWGTTWTAAEVNAAGFGVAISGVDSFDVAAVDHITITVTYSLCGDSNIEGSETCDDGNTVSGDCCSSTCQLEADGSPCTSDGNPCTDDECDGAGVCENNNNTAPCNDGDPCTSGDVCSGGSCAGSGFCLDHFKCYQGKDLKNPKFVKIDSVETDDQIINNQFVAVKKVKFICDAVDVNGGGIENPNAYLTCYLLKAPKLNPRPSLQVSTQFQVSQFQAKKGKLLCLPSTLDVLP